MSTAVVPLVAAGREAAGAYANSRPRADFVAQLIATSAQAPQTRARRRAEPEAAVAAYRARCQRPTLPGRAFSRSL